MQKESSLESDEAYAFEQGYRLNLMFGENLKRAEKEIRNNRVYARLNNREEKAIEALRKNLNNQKAFEAGKNARLKDKPDEFLLDQRREEYYGQKSKEESKQALQEKVFNFLGISPENIPEIKTKFKNYLKMGAYACTLTFGIWGLGNSAMNTILNRSTAGLEASFAICSIMTAVPLGQIGLKKIIDFIEQHKIKERQKADEVRSELVNEEPQVVQSDREKLMAEVCYPVPNIPVMPTPRRRAKVTIESPDADKRQELLSLKEQVRKKLDKGEISFLEAARRQAELDNQINALDKAHGPWLDFYTRN